MSACADKWMLLHAMIDGELDAANCVAIEAHIKTCAGCAEELARIEAVHDALSHAGMKHRAPSALHDKIAAQIDGQSGGGITARPQQRSIRPWLAGGLSAIAASLLLFAAVPLATSPRVGKPGSDRVTVAAPVCASNPTVITRSSPSRTPSMCVMTMT